MDFVMSCRGRRYAAPLDWLLELELELELELDEELDELGSLPGRWRRPLLGSRLEGRRADERDDEEDELDESCRCL